MPAEDGENAVKILHRNRQLCIVLKEQSHLHVAF